MSRAINPDRSIDCIGLFCPMPIVKIGEAIRKLEAGQVIEMVADDPASEADMKSWSRRTGHALLGVFKNDGVYHFLVRKAG